MLHYVWVAISGLIIGLIARFFVPGRDAMGFIVTAVVGIAGSLLATYVGERMGWYVPGETAGWIASVLGAIVLLAVLRALRGKL